MTPSQATKEPRRIQAVASYRLVDTPPEDSFDRLTALARQLFSVRLALITLVTEDRVWVKSRAGRDDVDEVPREQSFCTHVVDADNLVVCEDAARDERFADKPLTCNEPGIRFYAGHPLRPDGEHLIGTFCLFDDRPRELSEQEADILANLAHQAEELFRFHQARRELEAQYEQALISNARYGALIAGASVGILRVNSQGLVEDANPFLLDRLGYTIPDLRGTFLNRILPGTWRESDTGVPVQQPLNHENEHARASTASGDTVSMHLTMTRVSLADDDHHEYMIILTDLSEVHRARDEAEEANKAKTLFLSSMSHELRTPLNSIMGFAQLLENSQKPPLVEKQARHVGQIRRSGQHLLELINEVLDLARVESGRIQLSTESIHTGEALTEALETLSTMADNRAITLSMVGDRKTWPMVRADFTRLKQVLLNLLSNAIKYNRPEGKVLVRFEIIAGAAIIHFDDTGFGIPPDKMDQLFEPFDRLGADQGIEGTGIGLALTQRLLEAMDGHLHVESRPEVGSDFQIHLPLAESQYVHNLDPQGSSDNGAEAKDDDRPPCRRVLYVEDNPANQRLIQEALEDREDLELNCVHNAELGLDMARHQLIDIILMDINLPGIDGIEALKQLREDKDTGNIPVIAISANAMESDIRRGHAEGFEDYLTKPVEMTRLFAVIDQHLKTSDS